MYQLNRSRKLINRNGAIAIFFAIGLLLLLSCVQASESGEPIQQEEPSGEGELNDKSTPTGAGGPTSTPDRRSTDATRQVPTQALPGGLEWVETPELPAVTGEAPPELLDSIKADLAQRIGVDSKSMEVVRGESVVWNDGSLGCPKPGEFYTQALVNGYWVVLKVGDVEYDYRATDRGYFFLCEGGGSIAPISPETGPGYPLPPDN